MSAFARLIEGFRGLFRARWEELAEASSDIPSAGDVLDVLCAQLAPDWQRTERTRAVFALDTGDSGEAVVEELADEPGLVISLRRPRDRRGRFYSSHGIPGRPWPHGREVGGLELSGEPLALAALLDPDTRERLPRLLTELRLRLRESMVELEVAAGWDWIDLVHRARRGVGVLEQLSRSRLEQRSRLVERATGDPELEVRTHTLRLLADDPDFRSHPDELHLAIAGAANEGVARLAAELLPPGAGEALAGLASDRFERPDVRVCAAILLSRHDPPPRPPLLACLELRPASVVQLAPTLLATGDSVLREAVFERLRPILKRPGGAELTEPLRSELLTALLGSPGEQVAELLVAWRDAESDPLLLVELAEALLDRARADLVQDDVARLVGIVRDDRSRLGTRALNLLRRIAPGAVTLDHLAPLLEGRRARRFLAALELALAHGVEEAAVKVAGFDTWMEADEAEQATALLGQLGGKSAQWALLAVLRRSRWPGLAHSAVIALGQCGSLAAVEPLLEVEERGGDLGREARFSIEQIQQRLGAHERGGLALTEDDPSTGGLSVAGIEGELALADEES